MFLIRQGILPVVPSPFSRVFVNGKLFSHVLIYSSLSFASVWIKNKDLKLEKEIWASLYIQPVSSSLQSLITINSIWCFLTIQLLSHLQKDQLIEKRIPTSGQLYAFSSHRILTALKLKANIFWYQASTCFLHFEHPLPSLSPPPRKAAASLSLGILLCSNLPGYMALLALLKPPSKPFTHHGLRINKAASLAHLGS